MAIWHICHILNIGRKLGITMDKFEVEFYTKDNGEKPAKDFILGLDVKMRAKVLGIIDVLEEKGNQLREPYSKHLEDGIFEIRGKLPKGGKGKCNYPAGRGCGGDFEGTAGDL